MGEAVVDDEIPFYYGSAENKLNSKGQVAIPARFRAVLTEEDKARNHVITPGESNCLYMYTHRQFAKIKDNAKQYAEENGAVDLYRRFMAQATAVEIDTQGRFVLPQHMMRLAAIKGPTILFIGMNDRVELWEPAVYEEAMGRGAPEFDKIPADAARRIFGI